MVNLSENFWIFAQEMLRLSFQKAAFNLSAFMCTMAGVGFYTKGFLKLFGVLLILIGFTVAAISIYQLYLKRKLPFNAEMVYLLCMAILFILAVFYAFAISIFLGIIFGLVALFVSLCYLQLQGKAKFLPAK